MFTGLIEGLGTIAGITAEPAGMAFAIEPAGLMIASDSTAAIGDSVAINGCCLTIVSMTDSMWTFQAGKETLSKTNLGNLRLGDGVNLERSLPVNGRLGGHFVQGHVDGVGQVVQIDRDADWVTMGFRVPTSLSQLMVPKGSVAVDGISLTLVLVEPERFTVALIPHTLSVTNLGQRQIGQTVNIETDILGKYVHKLLGGKS